MHHHQEREQEQEQQKEVKARRDQQVEIEKFVDREYSRNEESPHPWHLSELLTPPAADLDGANEKGHPFYPLREFRLRHQENLNMPSNVYCSRNYFNPSWSGLRRIKNVVMVLEWAPVVTPTSTGGSGSAIDPASALRLFSSAEHESMALELTEARSEALRKAFLLLADGELQMKRNHLANAVRAITDATPDDAALDALLGQAAGAGAGAGSTELSLGAFSNLLRQGGLHPAYKGRYFVALSLAEAETLRRVLHLRGSDPILPGGNAEVALRYSPIASPTAAGVLTDKVAGDGGIVFDASAGWRKSTGATACEGGVAHNTFRFFDGDMHYSEPALNVLVRGLQASSTLERERFFSATIGVRRRMDRKWQETPLAKVGRLGGWVLLQAHYSDS